MLEKRNWTEAIKYIHKTKAELKNKIHLTQKFTNHLEELEELIIIHQRFENEYDAIVEFEPLKDFRHALQKDQGNANWKEELKNNFIQQTNLEEKEDFSHERLKIINNIKSAISNVAFSGLKSIEKIGLFKIKNKDFPKHTKEFKMLLLQISIQNWGKVHKILARLIKKNSIHKELTCLCDMYKNLDSAIYNLSRIKQRGNIQKIDFLNFLFTDLKNELYDLEIWQADIYELLYDLIKENYDKKRLLAANNMGHRIIETAQAGEEKQDLPPIPEYVGDEPIENEEDIGPGYSSEEEISFINLAEQDGEKSENEIDEDHRDFEAQLEEKHYNGQYEQIAAINFVPEFNKDENYWEKEFAEIPEIIGNRNILFQPEIDAGKKQQEIRKIELNL